MKDYFLIKQNFEKVGNKTKDLSRIRMFENISISSPRVRMLSIFCNDGIGSFFLPRYYSRSATNKNVSILCSEKVSEFAHKIVL